MKPSVLLFGDFQNVHLSEVSGSLLLEFAKSKGHLIDAKVYYNSLCSNQASAMDNLKSLGFKCFNVPCSLKNSADNQLIADCIKDSNNLSPDIVILVSGDGDFADLVITLQKLGIKVIIFALRGNVKQKMIELADEFHFIDKLADLVGEKSQTQPYTASFHISYNEAINYLVEAVKTAIRKGKRAVFSLIGKLMRELMREVCPQCQGFKSILTSEGKKFKNLSEFVEAVAKDGKVRIQNQELFLIEEGQLAN